MVGQEDKQVHLTSHPKRVLAAVALHILREVSHNIAGSHCFSIMADECTDCLNKEQFTINLRWVDQNLNVHEEFIGLYQVSAIDADSLVSPSKMCCCV